MPHANAKEDSGQPSVLREYLEETKARLATAALSEAFSPPTAEDDAREKRQATAYGELVATIRVNHRRLPEMFHPDFIKYVDELEARVKGGEA